LREKTTELREIVKRLDAIINILLETAEEKGKSLPVWKKIEMLHGVGLRPIEIAQILGITLSHVSADLYRKKKGNKAR
jgi:hypothetical protein